MDDQLTLAFEFAADLSKQLITVSTGLGYRLMRDWGGWGREQAHWLMHLHEGEWLGVHGETIYVLLNGLGLIWMLSTGLLMLLGKWLR